MPFVDPSQITARFWLIIGVCLVVGIALFHEFVVKPARIVDQLCDRAHILELETTAASRFDLSRIATFATASATSGNTDQLNC